MKQYLELAEAVKTRGTYKAPARDGMPGTTSLFGYQFRHDLSEGFPILTTKKISFKNIVVELLWFLRGDTNVKYLVDNGCNIWNEDAYSYYVKKCKLNGFSEEDVFSFEEFESSIKNHATRLVPMPFGYTLGDCGRQYGWLWRKWGTGRSVVVGHTGNQNVYGDEIIDQIKDLIEGLKTNPMGRRHILIAWNPATLNDMALNACHALVQFNCRPLTEAQKEAWRLQAPAEVIYKTNEQTGFTEVDHSVVPEYYLDCQMYQRSADLFLGVPYNISSYALLTHILCEICNMVPGEFIHTFGDVHIYDNHKEQIDEQLTREPKELPKLDLSQWLINSMKEEHYLLDFDEWIQSVGYSDFGLNGYDPHPAIKGELSTGIKK